MLNITAQFAAFLTFDQSRFNKYQLSLIDPRDGIVLWTELDDYYDKLAVDYELGGVINLVDQRWPSLSRSERPPLST